MAEEFSFNNEREALFRGKAYASNSMTVPQAYLNIQPWAYDVNLEILTSQDWETLYANTYSGRQPVEMPSDLEVLFNTTPFLDDTNLYEQLGKIMERYPDGPWYITGDDQNLIIHNHSQGDTNPDTIFIYGKEFGEVLEVGITSKTIYGGTAARLAKGLSSGNGPEYHMNKQTKIITAPKLTAKDVANADLDKIKDMETPNGKRQRLAREAEEAQNLAKAHGYTGNFLDFTHTAKVVLGPDGFPKKELMSTTSGDYATSFGSNTFGPTGSYDNYLSQYSNNPLLNIGPSRPLTKEEWAEINRKIQAWDDQLKLDAEHQQQARTIAQQEITQYRDNLANQIRANTQNRIQITNETVWLARRQAIVKALDLKEGLADNERAFLESIIAQDLTKVSSDDWAIVAKIIENKNITVEVNTVQEVYVSKDLSKQDATVTHHRTDRMAGEDKPETMTANQAFSYKFTWDNNATTIANLKVYNKDQIYQWLAGETWSGGSSTAARLLPYFSTVSNITDRQHVVNLLTQIAEAIVAERSRNPNIEITGVFIETNTVKNPWPFSDRHDVHFNLKTRQMTTQNVPIPAEQIFISQRDQLLDIVDEMEQNMIDYTNRKVKGLGKDITNTLNAANQSANKHLNKLKEARYRQVEVHLRVVGRPSLTSGTTLKLLNIGQRYSGTWLIKSCIHQIDSSGYTCSLNLIKDQSTEETFFNRKYIEPEKGDLPPQSKIEVWSRNNDGSLTKLEIDSSAYARNLLVLEQLNYQGEYKLANAAQILINNGRSIYIENPDGTVEVDYDLLERQSRQMEQEEQDTINQIRQKGFRNLQLDKISDQAEEANKALAQVNVKDPKTLASVKGMVDSVSQQQDLINSIKGVIS